MESILINKKLCEFIDDGYHQAFKVTLPKTAKLHGYAFEASSYLFHETVRDEVIRMDRPRYDDFVFTLVKIDREQGKRYSRPKLSWDELCEQFEVHSAEQDKSGLPQGLAFLYDYEYKGKVEIDREGHYAIGGIEGCWFYENGGNKKRTSAKNFRLLRMIEPCEVKKVKTQISRVREIDNQIAWIEHVERKMRFDVNKVIKERVPALEEASKNFISAIENAKENLKREQQEIISELEKS